LLLSLLIPIAIGAWVIAALQKEPGSSSPLVPLLGVAVCLSAALIAKAERRWHHDRYRPSSKRRALHAFRVGNIAWPGAAAVVAVALSFLAGVLTINALLPTLAVVAWLAALLLFLGQATLGHPFRLRLPAVRDMLIVAVLLALAAALRFPHLTDLPVFVHSDEAHMGLNTRIAFEGGMPSLFSTTNWWSVPWLGPALQAPLMLFFGDGLFAVRLASVLFGLLAIVGIWLLGCDLWSRWAGFVAAFLFVVLAPSVHFSRDGIHYMQAIAALVWTVWFYSRAAKRYSVAYAALTGIMIGVDVQLYYAARLAVPLIMLHATAMVVAERRALRTWLKLLLWIGMGAVATFLPLAMFYAAHPETFSQRTDAVFIFSSDPLAKAAVLHDYGNDGWLEVLGLQAQRVVLGFFSLGDRSEQYRAPFALLDPVTAAFVPAACALALARIRQSAWMLCAIWASVAIVLGGVLTTTQPDAPRLLAAIPALCLLVGGFAHTLLQTAKETGARSARTLVMLGVAMALAVSGALNTGYYSGVYPARADVQSVTVITDIARYLSTQPATRPVILFNPGGWYYLSHPTIALLAPQIRGTTVTGNLTQLDDVLSHEHDGFVLLAVIGANPDLQRIYQEYPGGTPRCLAVHDPNQVVTTYTYTGAGIT